MLFRASGAPPGGAERVPDFLRKPTFHLVDEDCTLPQCPRMGPGPSGITNDGDLSETNGGGAHRAATMRL